MRAAPAAGYEHMRRLGLAVSLAFAGIGLVLAVHGPRVLGGFDDALRARFFPTGPTPEALALRDFGYILFGATAAARWCLVAWLFHEPLRRRERWAFHAVVWSLVLGAGLEAAPATYRRAWFTLWYTTLPPLVAVGIPLWRMRQGLGAVAR